MLIQHLLSWRDYKRLDIHAFLQRVFLTRAICLIYVSILFLIFLLNYIVGLIESRHSMAVEIVAGYDWRVVRRFFHSWLQLLSMLRIHAWLCGWGTTHEKIAQGWIGLTASHFTLSTITQDRLITVIYSIRWKIIYSLSWQGGWTKARIIALQSRYQIEINLPDLLKSIIIDLPSTALFERTTRRNIFIRIFLVFRAGSFKWGSGFEHHLIIVFSESSNCVASCTKLCQVNIHFVSCIMLRCNTMPNFIVVQNMPQHPVLLIRSEHLKLWLWDKITLLIKWARRQLWRPILLIIKCHKLIFIEFSDGRRLKVRACGHDKGSWLPNLEMHLLCFLKFPLIFSHRSGLISFNDTIMHGLSGWLRS